VQEATHARAAKDAEWQELLECSGKQQRQLQAAAKAAAQQATSLTVATADLQRVRQQLSELQARHDTLAAQHSALLEQHAEAAVSAAAARTQLQESQAEAARMRSEADSAGREAASLRMQLAGQVAALQQIQDAASGSGKELQVGVLWGVGPAHKQLMRAHDSLRSQPPPRSPLALCVRVCCAHCHAAAA
jgi:uncharacterized phage infection (PIP) family protein YhgE